MRIHCLDNAFVLKHFRKSAIRFSPIYAGALRHVESLTQPVSEFKASRLHVFLFRFKLMQMMFDFRCMYVNSILFVRLIQPHTLSRSASLSSLILFKTMDNIPGEATLPFSFFVSHDSGSALIRLCFSECKRIDFSRRFANIETK